MIRVDAILALLALAPAAQAGEPATAEPATASADDATAARLDELEAEVQRLARQQQEQAERAAAARAVAAPAMVIVDRPSAMLSYDDGVRWADGTLPFALRMKTLVQVRYLAAKVEGRSLLDENGASLRRARFGFDGFAFSPKLGFKLEVELGEGEVAPLDVYVEGRPSPHWTIRAGQVRVPFSRSWMTPEQMLLFPERPVGTEEFRYGYDIGALVESQWFEGRVLAFLGVFNGAGPNVVRNDNIDPMLLLRVEATPTKELVVRAEGDRAHSPRPAVSVGASATADYVPAPAGFGYTSRVPIAPRPIVAVDSNNDGRADGVRVLEAELDAAVRWRGFAFDAELYGRREAWRDIASLQPVVQNRFTPREDYAGAFAQATYSWIRGWQVGGRLSVTELSPLSIGGQLRPVATCVGPDGTAFDCRLPYADRRAELSFLAAYSLYGGHIVGAVMYSLLNWGTTTGDPVPLSREHDVIAQVQFAL